MSREGAPEQREKQAPPAAGTPIWVWIVYALGILAAIVFAFSVLFTAGAVLLPNDAPASASFSVPAAIVWGALMVFAGATWYARRRSRR